jgi:RNA polymerase sigma-70 factor (ECF subfamily)
MPAQDDQELINRFHEGEESAFNDLVHRYQRQVYATARRLLGSHQEAQDISQEVFIKIYSSLRNFRGESSLSTWIFRIAVNLSLNALRKRKLRQFLSLDTVGLTICSRAPGADEEVERREQVNALGQAIDRLPNKQKLVFTLRYHQNLTHEEIAQILNRDVGTIKANYHHAIRKLQKAVKS